MSAEVIDMQAFRDRRKLARSRPADLPIDAAPLPAVMIVWVPVWVIVTMVPPASAPGTVHGS